MDETTKPRTRMQFFRFLRVMGGICEIHLGLRADMRGFLGFFFWFLVSTSVGFRIFETIFLTTTTTDFGDDGSVADGGTKSERTEAPEF